MKKLQTQTLVLCAVFCALISVGAQLTISLPYSSFTLQLLFTILTGLMLPPMPSLYTLLAYLLLGLVGAPVFAGFSGGLSAVTSPTFGFIIGMVVSTPLISWLFRLLRPKMPLFAAALAAGFVGIVLNYFCGAVFGYFYMRLIVHQQVDLWFIVWNWCLVYLPFDAAKLLLASLVTPPLLRRIPQLSR